MVGQFNGVASLLKAKYPLVKSFHCVSHRLNLQIKHAVDAVNNVFNFRCFVDELYKVYSRVYSRPMSPKHQSQLNLRKLLTVARHTNHNRLIIIVF